MWWIPSWKLLKDAWPAFALVGGAILVVVLGVVFGASRCASTPEPLPQPDYFDDVKQQILNDVAAAEKERAERIAALEAELFQLRDEIAALDEEIERSVQERKEIHHALSNARSIRDIDRILKRGIPGVSGRADE